MTDVPQATHGNLEVDVPDGAARVARLPVPHVHGDRCARRPLDVPLPQRLELDETVRGAGIPEKEHVGPPLPSLPLGLPVQSETALQHDGPGRGRGRAVGPDVRSHGVVLPARPHCVVQAPVVCGVDPVPSECRGARAPPLPSRLHGRRVVGGILHEDRLEPRSHPPEGVLRHGSHGTVGLDRVDRVDPHPVLVPSDPSDPLLRPLRGGPAVGEGRHRLPGPHHVGRRDEPAAVPRPGRPRGRDAAKRGPRARPGPVLPLDGLIPVLLEGVEGLRAHSLVRCLGGAPPGQGRRQDP